MSKGRYGELGHVAKVIGQQGSLSTEYVFFKIRSSRVRMVT